ncbi:MAG: translocation/assembly module TamB domain-containing protein [Bacteroidales bacterium]|nr:translocation/assembly module TamB domain-containing protein [Bacteroidales bacterium]
MKGLKRILIGLLAVVILIPVAAVVLVQIPAVQTFVGNKALKAISKNLGGSVQIGEIRYALFNTLILTDVTVLEPAGDTLLYAGKVLLEVDSRSLRRDTLDIRRVSVERCRATMHDLPESGTKTEKSGGGLPWKSIKAEKIAVSDLAFTYAEKGIQIEDFTLRADHLEYGGSIYGQLRELAFTEAVQNNRYSLSSGILVSDKMLYLNDFRLKDAHSDIDAPHIALYYDSFADFSDFLNKVEIDAEFTDACLDLASVQAFVPELAKLHARGYMSGQVKGKLGDLRADHLRFQSESRLTNLLLSARVKGLPDLNRTRVDATIHRSNTCVRDIVNVIRGINPQFDASTLLARAPSEMIDISGELHGTLKDAEAKLRLGSRQKGGIVSEAIWKVEPDGVPFIRGSVTTLGLNAGKYLGMKDLGKVTVDTHFDAKLAKSPIVNLKNLFVREIQYKGYTYSDIEASGSFENNRLLLNAASVDPNLYFITSADLDLTPKADNSYKITFDLARADLNALHLDKRERARFSMMADADVMRSREGVFTGDVTLSNVNGFVDSDFYNIGNVVVRAENDPAGDYTVTLDSKLAEASYRGTDHPSHLVEDVLSLLKAELGNLIPITTNGEKDHAACHGTLDFKTKDLRPLLAFVMPDLFISEGTNLKIDIDDCDHVEIGLKSGLVAVKDNYIRGIDIKANNTNGPLDAAIRTEVLQLGQIILHEDAIAASLQDNTLSVALNYDNTRFDGGHGRLNTVFTFPDRKKEPYIFVADCLPSEISIKQAGTWDIAPATLYFREGNILLEGFDISNGDQFISLDGAISDKPTDTLYLAVNQFDIGPFDAVFHNDMRLKGVFTGEAQATGLLAKELGVQAAFSGRDLSADGINLGDADLECNWNPEESRFDIAVDNMLDEDEPLILEGWYRPSDKRLALDLSLVEFNVGWVDPFVVDILDEMGGTISGDIHVEGPLDSLQISSNGVRFNDTRCRIPFTNVTYICNGDFDVNTQGIEFTNVDVADEYGNTGIARGGIKFNGFKNLDFDILFTVDEMLGINTTNAQADQGFYGKAFGSGTVHLYGPILALQMDIDLEASSGTVHIPISGGTVTQSDLLTFVNRRERPHIDVYDSLIVAGNVQKEKERAKGKGLSLNIKIAADPASEIDIDINEATGDIIRAHGNGNVEMKIEPKSFDIRGIYVIEDGSYTMSLMGLTAKDFTVEQGGTIIFGGDILQTEFNMNALYRTKASIETLIGDNTSVSTRRTVNCTIGISGAVSNPQLSFKIDIPDLDPTTQGLVENALSTDEKNLKQTLALLVSGSFVPDEQSGIVNNSTILYSNASEIVSSQINNIFHQLDIPVDLGLNYQPGAAQGTNDIFDVAISTQLFNNRVTINGNIGNQQYMSSSTSEVVGNVDVEIKLNRSGRLRLNLFSHAADRYSNYLDQTQRNGAGIVYQEEFDTVSDLWKKVFTRKKKEEEVAEEEEVPTQ